MSIRAYLLYISLALLLLILIGILIWPFLHVDRYLTHLIIDQFGRSFSGTVTLKRANPGFLALKLHDLQIVDRRGSIRLQIEYANIKFSIARLIKQRFNVVKSVESITLRAPKLSYQILPADSSEITTNNGPSLGWNFIDQIPAHFWIPLIDVSFGSIHLLRPTGSPLLSLQNLNGGLVSTERGVLKGRLQDGPINGNSTQTILSILVDGNRRILESYFTAAYEDLLLGEKQGLPDSLTLSLSRLDTDLRLWADADRSGLEGEINLNNLIFQDTEHELIHFDSLAIFLGDWELQVPRTKASGIMEEWTFQGEIHDLRTPALNFLLTGRSQDTHRLQSWLPDAWGIAPTGSVQLKVEIEGKPLNPLFQLTGHLHQLNTSLDTFEGLQLSTEFSKEKLRLTNLSARLPSGDIDCSGVLTVDPQRPGYHGAFQWRGVLPGLSVSRSGILDFQLDGTNEFHTLTGWWLADTGPSDSLAIEASYSETGQQLNTHIHIPSRRSVFDVIANDIFAEENFVLKFDEPLPIIRNLVQGEEWDRLEDIRLSGELTGTRKQATTKLEVFYGGGPSKFRFEGSVVSEPEKGLTYTGPMQFQQGSGPILEGSVDFNWSKGTLILRELELDAAIYAQGMVDFHSREIGFTELRISNWDVSRGIQLISPEWAERVGGVLDGRVEIYGSLDDPRASLNLYASRGHYRDQSDLWAVFSAELENNFITITECNLGRSVQSLVRMAGRAETIDHNLDLTILSQGADVQDFLEFLGINPLNISGPVTVDASIRGTFEQPEIFFELFMPQGRIHKLPFQHLTARAMLDSSTSYDLALTEFRIVQAPDLILTGEGILPFGKSPLALNLSLDGNVLKIPSLLDRAIAVSQGQGRLQLELVERDGRIALERARMDIQDGVMKFSDVVDEIRGLYANLRLEEGKLLIDNLSGEVSHQHFRFGNFFIDENSGDELEHLSFPSVNIDLGVITLETQGRGLYARIPSLMPPGVKGYIKFEGKDDAYYFLFAGPVQKPLFRGKLRVAGTILTYPFPPARREPSRFIKSVLSVLASVRWDVDIVPERDNRYAKELRTASETVLLEGVSDLFTTVDVNLNINPGRSSLKLQGSFVQEDFRMLGSLISTRGTIDYLDMKFTVDRFGVEFDLHDPLPWVEGRGQAIYLDSLGQTRNVYLTLYVVDPVTGERVKRGRWGDFIFIIEDDAGSSQEQILAAMGYSPEQIQDKMTSISGQIISDAVLRRLLRPIERELETVLRMDVIRLQPTFAQHFFETQFLGLDTGPVGQEDWGAYLLRQSQVSVGKYIGNDLFVSYTGRWDTGIDAREERRYGFLHKWSLEYRIREFSDNLVLNYRYEYDTLEDLTDQELLMRYSFIF
jgi:hypothetical protein